MTLPDDYAERIAAVNGFVRCPECDSTDATVEVEHDPDVPEDSLLRAMCRDCGHTTSWVPL